MPCKIKFTNLTGNLDMKWCKQVALNEIMEYGTITLLALTDVANAEAVEREMAATGCGIWVILM